MIEYTLCVDESGDFGRDIAMQKVCIVGGILYRADKIDDDYFAVLLDEWRNDYPEQYDLITHATELTWALAKNQTADLASISRRILTDLHKDTQFVVFENNARVSIADNNTTYINVLVEGVIQLLELLVAKEKSPIHLHCMIANRSNMTGRSTVYPKSTIACNAYEFRMNERLSFAKAKISNRRIFRSQITINSGDAKTYPALIAADHVSHFWFTKRKSYNRRKGLFSDIPTESTWTICKEYYDPSFVFPLFVRDEDEYVRRMLLSNTLSDALYEYLCDGLNSDYNKKLILDAALDQPKHYLERQLDNLTNYINNIIEQDHNLIMGEKLLQNADLFISYLKENGKPIPKFEIDILLLKLAVCNHQGDLHKMELIFEQATPAVLSYMRQRSDIRYYVMLKNREAVYLQDICDPATSLAVCKSLQKLLTGVYSTISLDDRFNATPGVFRSEELGKVLGTAVQAYTALIRRKEDIYTEAAEVSDMAMEQFDNDTGKERQYQYRALLESAAGRFSEAFSWMQKSFKMSWQDWLTSVRKDVYGVMNLSRIADDMACSELTEIQIQGIKIASIISDHIKSPVNDTLGPTYPQIAARLYLGRALSKSPQTLPEAKKLLRQMDLSASSYGNIVFSMMRLEARIIDLNSLEQVSFEEMERRQTEFLDELQRFRDNNSIPEKMKSATEQWYECVSQGHPEEAIRIC